MKCPKCGYNSFDHLESCKKCGEDMDTHKAKFGLRSLFSAGRNLPVAPAAPVEETESETLPGVAVAPADPTDFGFDLMGEEEFESDPLESPLDELLDPDLEGEFAAISAQAEEDEETVPGGAAGFDFTWEEEPLTKEGDSFGDVATPAPEPFSEFEEDEESLPELFRDTDPAGDSPDLFGRKSEPASGSTHEEHPELAFGEKADETPEEIPCVFEEGSAGHGFVTKEQQPVWEDISDPAGGAAEPAILSESIPAAETSSWDDSSEEPSENWSSESGFSERNLGELFLESLDQTTDGSTEAAPSFWGEEDPLIGVSSEVKLVESQLQEPSEVEGEEEKSAPPETPPLTSRIGSGIADMVILAVVFILFIAAGEVALGSGHNGGLFPSQEKLLELAAPYFLLLFALCFGYFTLFHFLIGQTPGKMFFRIRVVGEDGGGLMFSQAFLRSVGGLLSLLPVGLGFLRILFDGERRGWNDRLANSRVIPVAGWNGLEIMDERGLAEEG